jgi:hypothetical protein
MESREDKLIKAVERYRHKAFDWKTFNCGLAAADIASSYCNRDYAEKWRPLCSGRISAMKAVLRAGGLEQVVDDLGLECISVKMARRGDVVLTTEDRRTQALGIVYDGARAVFPTQFGLAYVNVFNCAKAWRVI